MNNTLIYFLLLLSAVFAITALLIFIVRLGKAVFNKRSPKSRLGWYVLLIFAAIWCLRYSVGYYSCFYPNAYITTGLTTLEEKFNSIIHTLQTFSMDEDYTEYISAGKDMMKLLRGEESSLVWLYGLYASVLNFLAPILGGVFILDILQGAFPKIKLFFMHLAFWKTKYYFSELNEASLACAESILNQKYAVFCRPVIIFTDVYTDGENEKSSELLKKAKTLGGICITDDLTHIKLLTWQNNECWLMDEKEIDNIKTLSVLADEKHYKNIKKTTIRIFYQDDSYTLTELGIIRQLRKDYEEKIFKRNKKGNYRYIPYCKILLQSIRELKDKLEKEYNIKTGTLSVLGKFQKSYLEKTYKELFETYYSKKSEKDPKPELEKVRQDIETLAKNHYIDKKAPAVIRTRYYQNLIYKLLQDHPLYHPLIGRKKPSSLDVAILGNGSIGMEMFLSTYWCGQLLNIPLSINVVSKDESEAAVAKINKVSSEIIESTKEKCELLRVYDGKEIFNKPYFTFRYCKSDVDFEDISAIKCSVPNSEASDYSLLDSDYYFVALGDDEVNIRVAERLMKAIAIHQKQPNAIIKNVDIAYVVYDANLCEALNASLKQINDSTKNIHMYAVGSIADTYSFENIMKKDYMVKKLEGKVKKTFSHSEWVRLSNMMSLSGKPYEFWSTYARGVHYSYKVFSAYYQSRKKREYATWQKKHMEFIYTPKCYKADELAWLEHRRWNAYMRSIGFKYNAQKDVVFLKTHDCLVEHHEPKSDFSVHDRLEKVKDNRDQNIINYDYEDGIISETAYKELIDKENCHITNDQPTGGKYGVHFSKSCIRKIRRHTEMDTKTM